MQAGARRCDGPDSTPVHLPHAHESAPVVWNNSWACVPVAAKFPGKGHQSTEEQELAQEDGAQQSVSGEHLQPPAAADTSGSPGPSCVMHQRDGLF